MYTQVKLSDHYYKRANTKGVIGMSFILFLYLILGINMSTDGQLPIPTRHKGTSDASRMNMIDDTCSMQQSLEGLMKQSIDGVMI